MYNVPSVAGWSRQVLGSARAPRVVGWVVGAIVRVWVIHVGGSRGGDSSDQELDRA